MTDEDKTLLKPEFWAALGIRTARTFAQTLGGFLLVGTPIFSIDWKAGVAISASAALLAILTGIASPGSLREIGPKPAAD